MMTWTGTTKVLPCMNSSTAVKADGGCAVVLGFLCLKAQRILSTNGISCVTVLDCCYGLLLSPEWMRGSLYIIERGTSMQAQFLLRTQSRVTACRQSTWTAATQARPRACTAQGPTRSGAARLAGRARCSRAASSYRWVFCSQPAAQWEGWRLAGSAACSRVPYA